MLFLVLEVRLIMSSKNKVLKFSCSLKLMSITEMFIQSVFGKCCHVFFAILWPYMAYVRSISLYRKITDVIFS